MRRIIVLCVVVALTVLGVPTAALADDEVDVEVVIHVKMELEAIDAVHEIASLEGAEVTALIASRGVFMMSRIEQIKEKDHDKAEDEFAKDVEKHDGVAWAASALTTVAGDDRYHAWHLDDPEDAAEDEADNQAAFAELGLDAAHEIATGAGVVVAVLDTGIDAAHPLLAGRVVPGYDMVDDDADPSEEANGLDDDADGQVDEAHGHGTFVAGVVAQVAPDAMIMPIRVLDADGRGEIYAVIEAVEFAVENGADVINLSLGLLDGEDSKILKGALKDARKAEIAVVAAAGNTGDDEKHFPASEKDVISVTAANPGGETVASFASRGKWVDLAAPGVQIVSAMPGGEFAEWAGTSVAAPIVAGQLALMRELEPTQKIKDIEKALWKAARKMDDESGQGAEEGMTDILASVS